MLLSIARLLLAGSLVLGWAGALTLVVASYYDESLAGPFWTFVLGACCAAVAIGLVLLDETGDEQ